MEIAWILITQNSNGIACITLINNEFSIFWGLGVILKKKNLTLDVSNSCPLLQISYSKNKPYDV